MTSPMTSHTGRLYALALGLVVFFLAWATVAAHPWAATGADPRLKALAVRESRLRHEAKLVQAVVSQRWATYRSRLEVRRAEIAAAKAKTLQLAAAASASSAAAAAPSVRVVNLPPLTITRTS
jgi:hypothetical protein